MSMSISNSMSNSSLYTIQSVAIQDPDKDPDKDTMDKDHLDFDANVDNDVDNLVACNIYLSSAGQKPSSSSNFYRMLNPTQLR